VCGRYTLFKLEQLLHRFPWIERPPVDAIARYNVAPTQPVLVISNERPDRFDFFNWGLIPPWAKDPSVGGRMINARVETVAEKPAYAKPFRRRRCLVPADGFYEWRREPGGKTKTPMLIRLKSGEPFAFAGLWESWHSADGSEIVSCTLITGKPNEVVAPIHDRMVVILKPEHYQRWLDPDERAPDELLPMLTPYPADEMEAFPVSRLVNSPKNESPDCVKPVASETLF
jgi:putative SOS response-associated peptidase YedK